MVRGTLSHKECVLLSHGCGTIVYKGTCPKRKLYKGTFTNYSLLLLGLCVRWDIWKSHRLLILCTCDIRSQSRKETGMLTWKIQFSPLVGFYRPSLIFTVWGFKRLCPFLCYYLPSQKIAANTSVEIALFTYTQSHFKHSRLSLQGLMVLVTIVCLELMIEK